MDSNRRSEYAASVPSGVGSATRDSRGHQGRDDAHQRDGENDRYQDETVRYHFQAPALKYSMGPAFEHVTRDTGYDAAFYPKANDRGKNGRLTHEVSGFDTLPSTYERHSSDILHELK